MRRFIRDFLQLESASSVLLLLATLLAMVVANSNYAQWHQFFIGHFLFVINDGLMTLFFLVIGIELKRSFLNGPLSDRTQIVLPALAAFGGMLIPAFVYLAFNWGDPVAVRAWATPVATDIAFAVGVLSFFGSRVPQALKVFLLALAIFDDLGAILIIALFYSQGISFVMLGVAALIVMMLYGLNRYRIQSVFLYVILGIALWAVVLLSGIHPTLAGVLFAFLLPHHTKNHQPALLIRFEKGLHPWVAYLIMPLFAFVNMGFPLGGIHAASFNGIVLGIALGLLIGKPIGVFGMSWWWIRSGFGKLPAGVSWMMLLGVASLCGIGFTMSLFLGTLSFESDAGAITMVRLGVLLGSVSAALVGAYVLSRALPRSHAS